MNKLRKKKLTERAYAVAKAKGETVGDIGRIAHGIELGYRMAMADARKAVGEAEQQWKAMHQHGPEGAQALRRTMLLDAVKRFLLPLR